MGSSIDDEYIVTCVAAIAAWYSPYVRWGGGGASGCIVGGGTGCVVGWVCGREFSGCVFLKACSWVIVMGFFWGGKWV